MKDLGALDLSGNFNGSLLSMILDAGLMVKFVLLVLFIFSVVSTFLFLFLTSPVAYGSSRAVTKAAAVITTDP